MVVIQLVCMHFMLKWIQTTESETDFVFIYVLKQNIQKEK